MRNSRGQSGFVPSNYVETKSITEFVEEPAASTSTVTLTPTPNPNPQSNRAGNCYAIRASLVECWGTQQATSGASGVGATGGGVGGVGVLRRKDPSVTGQGQGQWTPPPRTSAITVTDTPAATAGKQVAAVAVAARAGGGAAATNIQNVGSIHSVRSSGYASSESNLDCENLKGSFLWHLPFVQFLSCSVPLMPKIMLAYLCREIRFLSC